VSDGVIVGVAGTPWRPSVYCQVCIQRLLGRQWDDYTNAVNTSTCAAEIRRLLARGPPINLRVGLGSGIGAETVVMTGDSS
jgi:hypothetical protein